MAMTDGILAQSSFIPPGITGVVGLIIGLKEWLLGVYSLMDSPVYQVVPF